MKEIICIDWANASPQRKLEFLEQNIDKCAICQEPLQTREFVEVCDCGHKMHKDCAKKWARKTLEKSFPVLEDNPHSINSTGVNDRDTQYAHFGMYQCPSYCRKWQCYPVFEGDGTTPSVNVNNVYELNRRFEGPPKSLWDLQFIRSQQLRRDVIEYNCLVVDCTERGLFPDGVRRQDIRSIAERHGLSSLEFLRRRLRLADEIEEQRLAHIEANRRRTTKEFVITREALLRELSLGLHIDDTDDILIVERVAEGSLAARVGMKADTIIQHLKMETATDHGSVTHSVSPRTIQEVQSFIDRFKLDLNAVQFTITVHPHLVRV